MSATSAVLAGRRAAEALMLDTGKAIRPDGTWTLVNGIEVQSGPDLFTNCPCKVQTPGLRMLEQEVADRTSVVARVELHLPADTDPLQVGDLWEFTAVDALSLQTVGQRLRVVGPASGTVKTARRYPVEEVVS